MKRGFAYDPLEIEIITLVDVIVTSAGGTLDPEEDVWG